MLALSMRILAQRKLADKVAVHGRIRCHPEFQSARQVSGAARGQFPPRSTRGGPARACDPWARPRRGDTIRAGKRSIAQSSQNPLWSGECAASVVADKRKAEARAETKAAAFRSRHLQPHPNFVLCPTAGYWAYDLAESPVQQSAPVSNPM